MGSVRNAPAPIVLPSSRVWDGNDGRWSTFNLSVGTPPQTFRLLPSTSGRQILILHPDGCRSSDGPDCPGLRGVDTFRGQQIGFQFNSSSTWKLIGMYSVDLARNLNYTGVGLYGLDTVGIIAENATDIRLEKQLVAPYASKDYYLGMIGLGPKATNFTTEANPQPSFMTMLKNEGFIPSFSFGYTAGAAYRSPELFGSLTLGGYDSSLIDTGSSNPTNTTDIQSFPFSSNDERLLSIDVQSITALNTPTGARAMVNPYNKFTALIDSTVPHLWLPRSVCDQFEQAFGLAYDPVTGLYLVPNSTIHQKLADLNPSVVIALGSGDPARAVTITLPYAAFDLQASSPIYPNKTNYFPIRRAANESQYTLGRTFLQEAYVVADHERANFSIYQVKQSAIGKPNIVAISAPGQQFTHPSKARLSSVAIAGIVIGVVLGLLLVAGLLFAVRRYRRGKRGEEIVDDTKRSMNNEEWSKPELEPQDRYEMGTGKEEEMMKNYCAELHHDGLYLLSDDGRHELAGSEVNDKAKIVVEVKADKVKDEVKTDAEVEVEQVEHKDNVEIEGEAGNGVQETSTHEKGR